MRVLIFGGDSGIGEGIAQFLQKEHGDWVTKSYIDVRRYHEVMNTLRAKQPEWVINCAGISDEEQPDVTIDVNLKGAMKIAAGCAQFSIPNIHIASVAGLHGKPGHVAYSVSKAGVIAMVEARGFNERIWAISPGRVDTPMREKDYPNDTPGSRLKPETIGYIVEDIMHNDLYLPGTNVIIRKVGLVDILVEEEVNPWKTILKVGEPVTI